MAYEKKEPKEAKPIYTEQTPDILPLDAGNYQDSFLYSKSIEKLRNLDILDPTAAYTLPTATTSVLGGVKVDGTTITITGGVISSVGTTKKYCFATIAGNAAIANTTGTSIPIDTYETNDTDMSATSGRIIIKSAGRYIVTGAVQFGSNATGSREAYFRINGSAVFADNYAMPNTADLTSVVLSAIKTFALNDYIEIRAYQNSGGSLNAIAGIANTFVSVHQL